ncbi:hypothetical protein [Bacteriovorax sp. Seq25_V]|uniref:hypothetical protein n=1 Tax=Bacteriovorax sp. Seq25_V TaxID=1201288 RepID=UPI000389E04B|nr:hypothetical protein [Bacteriovorax sp. Seq25_V]EQC47442.1 hypothetical protein M900_0963 [Bacteriovorax sp. Seq25_V]
MKLQKYIIIFLITNFTFQVFAGANLEQKLNRLIKDTSTFFHFRGIELGSVYIDNQKFDIAKYRRIRKAHKIIKNCMLKLEAKNITINKYFEIIDIFDSEAEMPVNIFWADQSVLQLLSLDKESETTADDCVNFLQRKIH